MNMAEYTYPGSDLDDARALLSLLGSFWAQTYAGNDPLRDLLFSSSQAMAQAHQDLVELIASTSHLEVPVFHRENWVFLPVRESEINQSDLLLSRFENESENTFDESLQFGVVGPRQGFAVEAPKDLADVRLVLNRMTESSLTWTRGIDFHITGPGVIVFRENPLENPLVPTRGVYEDGELVDREAGLWLYRGEYDWNTVYEQFGYVLSGQLKSSQGYKDLLAAVLSGITAGTSVSSIQTAWSAITGVPLSIEPVETVEVIDRRDDRLSIVTDRHAYRFSSDASPIVEVGDTLKAGDPLVDTLQFFSLNDGEARTDLAALTLGPGTLVNGFLSELTFENKDVPLHVEETDRGTKVWFDLVGHPGDIEKFWDDTHNRAEQLGLPLFAELLDLRDTIPEDAPPFAGSLPVTINPMKFLIENLFRFHGFIVRVKASGISRKSLGLEHGSVLREIVPPHTLMIVLVDLNQADEPIRMDREGDAERPGGSEQQTYYMAAGQSDTVDHGLVSERVRIRPLTGKCE